MKWIGADQLRATLCFEDLIEPTVEAFIASSTGKAANGFLTMYPLTDPAEGDVFVKTGALIDKPYCIVKIAPWFAAPARLGEAQGGLVAVLDSRTGRTVALLNDEHYLSDIRTAAAGALAARYLAPHEIETVCILGAGTQAYWQVMALRHERPFKHLSIWARRADRAHAFRERLKSGLGDVGISIAEDAETAVRAADVVLCATLAREPIVRGEWLRPGQHVTSVGADDPSKCEVDANALERSRVYVDDRLTAQTNGNVARAIAKGAYDAGLLAGEIGEVIAGRRPGRTVPSELTIANLVGIGAQDVAAASVAVARLSQAPTATAQAVCWDSNSPHIPSMHFNNEVAAAISVRDERIAELETQLSAFRKRE